MRTLHAAHPIPFPAYCSAFVSDDTFIIAGGGGASKTGVKNIIRVYRVKSVSSVELLHQLPLSSDEDAPNSLAFHKQAREFVCGINSSEQSLRSGDNQNCRVFSLTDESLSFSRAANVFPDSQPEDYIRVAAFSETSGLLCLASSTREIALLSYPSLTELSTLTSTLGEIYDLDFYGQNLACAGTSSLAIYSIESTGSSQSEGQSKKKGRQKKKAKSKQSEANGTQSKHTVDLVQSLQVPELPLVAAEDTATFRAAKYDPLRGDKLYAVVNTTPSRKSKGKGERKSFLVIYETATWKATKVKRVGEKGSITCFDISPDGRFLAFGTSGCRIGLLDARTLAPVFTILRVHEFPPTTLKFNTSGTKLVSGSADNTFRLVEVPSSGAGPAWITILLTIALMILIAAVALKMLQN